MVRSYQTILCTIFVVFDVGILKIQLSGSNSQGSRCSELHATIDGPKGGMHFVFFRKQSSLTGPLLATKYLQPGGEMSKNKCHPLESLCHGDSKYPTFSIELLIEEKLWPCQKPTFAIFSGGFAITYVAIPRENLCPLVYKGILFFHDKVSRKIQNLGQSDHTA